MRLDYKKVLCFSRFPNIQTSCESLLLRTCTLFQTSHAVFNNLTFVLASKSTVQTFA